MTSLPPNAAPIEQPCDRSAGSGGGRMAGRRPRRGGGAAAWTVAASLGAALFAGLAVAAPDPKKPAAKPAAAKPGDAKKGDGKRTEGKPAAAPATGPAATAPALLPSGRAVPVVVPPDPAVLTDEMVDQAIRKGSDFLFKKFDPKTHLVAGAADKLKEDAAYAGGLDALAVYALMQAGLALKTEAGPTTEASAAAVAKADAQRDAAQRLALNNPEMQAKIDAMMKVDISKGRHQTYAHGLRSTALALYVNSTPDFDQGKPEPGKAESAGAKFKAAVKDRLKADAEWGVTATNDGSYTYSKGPKTPKDLKEAMEYYKTVEANFVRTKELPLAKGGFDNSNCQYGLLGVWSAAEADVEIPSMYWYLVANHWTKKQFGSGFWQYGEDKELSANPINMTAAGLASVLVTHEYIEPVGTQAAVGREPYNTAIKRGLGWFDAKDNAVKVSGGYGTYGVERVGLASGFKFFGQHDWYRELAAKIIKEQKPDGSWGSGGKEGDGQVIETSYHLLFLSRGRHPVLMNKLRFDGNKENPGYWANRPRDAANLSKAVGKEIEKQLNWQVINVNTPWQQWLDSPILSLGTHRPFKFSEEELGRIRSYVEAGGMLYTQSDASTAAVDQWANQLAQQLFKRPLVPVPANHPLYTNETVYKIVPPVPLKMVTNGSRVLMVHSGVDLARSWQARDEKGKAGKVHFQLGVNLYIYAAGKGQIRRRLETLDIPEVAATRKVQATVGVARLSYPASPGGAPTAAAPAAPAAAGSAAQAAAAAAVTVAPDWNPEPGAWPRFANWLQWQTSYKLAAAAVPMEQLKPFDPARKTDPANYRFAHLTGVAAVKWTPAQVAAVKAFVDAGGVLMVDVTGGANTFDQSAHELIDTAFGSGKLAPVPPEHPMLSASAQGMDDLTRRIVRQSAKGKGGTQLQMLTSGKGAVVFSPLDITSGLLGTNTVSVVGYDHAYATKLMKNALLWALDGTPAGAVAPPPAAAADPAAAVPAGDAQPAAAPATAPSAGADAGK
jgi:hypothetical protein